MTAEFTPTQQRMLDVLSDGGLHGKDELVRCMSDPLSDNIKPHLHRLRKLLRPQGHDIVLQYGPDRRWHYRHVVLLTSSNE